jgi:sigma-B regulation protein RsbU (phosphoserine phosphatase)
VAERDRKASESDLLNERRALLEAVGVLVSTLELETVLQRLLHLTHRMLGFDYCTILLIGEDGRKLEVAARYGYPDSIVQKIELDVGKGLTGRVAETGSPMIVPDVSKEERYLPGLRGARSELVAPLTFGDDVIGVFDVQSPQLGAFSERDLEMVTVLAGIASVAIVNAKNHAAALRSRDEASRRRALERQIDLARTFQEHLLPRRQPAMSGFDLAGVNLPGETLSGDYFDYIELPHGHLGIAVADVSGEGVPAALLAASLQGTLRAHIENVYSISTIIERVNNSLCRATTPENFATLFYGVLDPAGTLTYVNAGHNPPLLLRTDGSVERLSVGGTVIGVFPETRYPHGRVGLGPGDYLVMYTDGLTESFHDDEPFGEARVIDTMRRVRGAPANIMASVLVTEADAFSGPGASPDDITVVVVRRLGGEPPTDSGTD